MATVLTMQQIPGIATTDSDTHDIAMATVFWRAYSIVSIYHECMRPQFILKVELVAGTWQQVVTKE